MNPKSRSGTESGAAAACEPRPLAGIPSPHSLRNRVMRAIWSAVYVALFRPSPKILHSWRRFLLRTLGAQIARTAVIHPAVRIWAPWNLTMHEYASLAPHVDCYNVAPVTVGAGSTISQYSYLCTATHDYRRLGLPLIARPICIGAQVWVCADVFVGPGVTIGDGAVIGARSSVYKNVEPWWVVAGNPARKLKQRELEPALTD